MPGFVQFTEKKGKQTHLNPAHIIRFLEKPRGGTKISVGYGLGGEWVHVQEDVDKVAEILSRYCAAR